jgi:hypothetical protein
MMSTATGSALGAVARTAAAVALAIVCVACEPTADGGQAGDNVVPLTIASTTSLVVTAPTLPPTTSTEVPVVVTTTSAAPTTTTSPPPPMTLPPPTTAAPTTPPVTQPPATMPPQTSPPVVTIEQAPQNKCDPNYSGCVPIASDVDCAGGSGNGPAYVRGPVRVIGSDIYDLDRDGDGVACQS